MLRAFLSTYCFCVAALLAAQPQIEFSETTHNLGSVLWQTPQTVTFSFINKGTRDLSILSVEADCACTVPTWTSAPVSPGARGSISVSFDAALLGHFSKGVTLYTNIAPEPFRLHLIGDVVASKQGVSVDMPVKMGELQLSTDNLEFDDINRGDQPQKIITIYNGSKTTYRPQLMHLPRYLSATYVPEVVRSGRMGEIVVTLDSRELSNMGVTQTSVYLSRFPGDRVSTGNEIAISATLLPQFSGLPKQVELAPCCQVDSVLELGPARGKKKLKGELMLTNSGRTPLEIQALQVYNSSLSVSIGKRVIAPGERVKLKIGVNMTLRSKGRRRVLLITNDPRRPKVVIEVKIKE